MNLLPVSAKRLHHRALRMRDRLIGDASLFPFFDDGGGCAWVMIVSPSSSEIWVVRWRRRLFRANLWGPVVCTEGVGALGAIGEEQAKALRALWHYDPWWVLGEDRYANHWATRLLKETNCAEQLDPGVRMLFFRSNLSRLSVVYLKHGKSSSFENWKSHFLRASRPGSGPAPPAEPRRLPTWCLEPIWKPWMDQ